MPSNRKDRPDDQDFRFRVSDVYRVPRRGHVIRLKVLDGSPAMKRLKRGNTLWLEAPSGEGRTVDIADVAVTSGNATQHRLDRFGELDLVISDRDALGGEEADSDALPVAIGWHAFPEAPDGPSEE